MRSPGARGEEVCAYQYDEVLRKNRTFFSDTSLVLFASHTEAEYTRSIPLMTERCRNTGGLAPFTKILPWAAMVVMQGPSRTLPYENVQAI